ncbi:hypothetical protein Anapl_01211 [Anas platyrhynchos]|uniref:Uncharacterized protein n=1 Tax=Anas platyrhynchos TaxID=8839 RepID=R0K7L7_ANAPL|nr:hypothetical protein Anapl_01211 [Anas platyrhynchos]
MRSEHVGAKRTGKDFGFPNSASLSFLSTGFSIPSASHINWSKAGTWLLGAPSAGQAAAKVNTKDAPLLREQHSHVPCGYHVLQLGQLTHTVPAAHTAPATGFRQGLSNSPQASQQQPRPLQGRLNFVVSPSNTHTPLRVRLIREQEVPQKSTQNEQPGLHRQQPRVRVRWQDRSHPTACALPAVICRAAAGGSNYLQGRCSS